MISMRLITTALILVAGLLLEPACSEPLLVPPDAEPSILDAAVAPPDLAVPADLAAQRDIATGVDLAAPRDLAASTDAGTVFCSLPDQPIPCAGDGECAAFGARCGALMKVCECLVRSCTPGADQSCNEDPRLASLHGHCTAFGACECRPMYPKSQSTGKCL